MKFVLLINLKLLSISNSFLLSIAEHETVSTNKYENANNKTFSANKYENANNKTLSANKYENANNKTSSANQYFLC